jgi:hypothetical protein
VLHSRFLSLSIVGERLGDELGELPSRATERQRREVALSDPFGLELNPSVEKQLGPAPGEVLGAALSLGNERSASLGAFSLSTFSKRLGDDMKTKL